MAPAPDPLRGLLAPLGLSAGQRVAVAKDWMSRPYPDLEALRTSLVTTFPGRGAPGDLAEAREALAAAE